MIFVFALALSPISDISVLNLVELLCERKKTCWTSSLFGSVMPCVLLLIHYLFIYFYNAVSLRSVNALCIIYIIYIFQTAAQNEKYFNYSKKCVSNYFFFCVFCFFSFSRVSFSQVQTAVFAHFACYYYLICMYIYRYIYMCILLVSWG